jgi:hypothetical protein
MKSMARRQTATRNSDTSHVILSISRMLATVPAWPWPIARPTTKNAHRASPMAAITLDRRWRRRNGTELERQKT